MILLLVNVNLGSGEKDGREGGKKKMCVTFIHRDTLVIIKYILPSWLFLSRYFFLALTSIEKSGSKGECVIKIKVDSD